jgi:hypothetical protein
MEKDVGEAGFRSQGHNLDGGQTQDGPGGEVGNGAGLDFALDQPHPRVRVE